MSRPSRSIFKKMYDKGDIYKGTYKGKYCTPCESFWTESQLKDGKLPRLRPRGHTTRRRRPTSSACRKYADRMQRSAGATPTSSSPAAA